MLRRLASYTVAWTLVFAPAALAEEQTMAELVVLEKPRSLPSLQYRDEQGSRLTLQTGGPPLTAIHLWATWCVPCVAEMPVVNAVQQRYIDRGFKVIPISLDANMDKIRQFYRQHNIRSLVPLLDVNMASFRALGAPGLPVTVFFNAKGQAIARADGPLDWNSPPVKQLIESNLNPQARNARY